MSPASTSPTTVFSFISYRIWSSDFDTCALIRLCQHNDSLCVRASPEFYLSPGRDTPSKNPKKWHSVHLKWFRVQRHGERQGEMLSIRCVECVCGNAYWWTMANSLQRSERENGVITNDLIIYYWNERIQSIDHYHILRAPALSSTCSFSFDWCNCECWMTCQRNGSFVASRECLSVDRTEMYYETE